ncbi:MAG: MATE family efflux transporter [Phycisphaerales bacterium]|nr:MAG: MATE family efflux transporter [Phycisphaerales bacterium]
MSVHRPDDTAASTGDTRREEIRSVVTLSVPIVITMCSRVVMDVSDFTMMKWLGPDAQAALLPGQVMLWCYIVLGIGIVSMVSTFASQCLGRKRYADCSAYAWQGVYLSLLFGLLGLALRPSLPAVVAWMGHEPQIQQLELAYLNIAVFAIAPTLAAAALSHFFNGIHRPRVTMWSAIEGNVVNAVLSLVLIFGLAGCPKLGIAGAAWGTLAGTVYRTLRLAITMCGRGYAEPYAGRRTWRPDRVKIAGVLRVGAPSGIQLVSDVIVWTVFINILVGKYFGTVHLIATNVVWQYLRISFMPCLGIGFALTALVGRAIGESDCARAVRLARIAIAGMALYMAVLSVIYFVGRHSFVALFNGDPQIVRIGASVLICASIFQVFDAMGMGYNSALRGAGDTLWPSVVFVVTHWVIVIGGGFAMVHLFPELGSLGPWIAATVLIILVGWVMWWRWHARKWMTIDLLGQEEDAGLAPGDRAEPALAGSAAASEASS